MRLYLLPLVPVLFAFAAQAQLTVTLTPSDYNDYSVSCFGGRDGNIDTEVTGGIPPYHYQWLHRDTVPDVSGLAAGYYKLTVTDSDTSQVTVDITLKEPPPLKLQMEPYKYPNGFNISCNDCYNGSIDLTVYGGVEAYQFSWNDDVTTEDRSALGSASYRVTVTDANSCKYRSEALFLTQPERDAWTKSGNAGTDANSHFIGTSDAEDVVIQKQRDRTSAYCKCRGDHDTGVDRWRLSLC